MLGFDETFFKKKQVPLQGDFRKFLGGLRVTYFLLETESSLAMLDSLKAWE